MRHLWWTRMWRHATASQQLTKGTTNEKVRGVIASTEVIEKMVSMLRASWNPLRVSCLRESCCSRMRSSCSQDGL